jgi:hypothetical protein
MLRFLEQAEAYGTGIQSSTSHVDVLTEDAISEDDDEASVAQSDDRQSSSLSISFSDTENQQPPVPGKTSFHITNRSCF